MVNCFVDDCYPILIVITQFQYYKICSRNGRVLSKGCIGCKDKFQIFKNADAVSENWWGYKFWILFNGKAKNIEIYEVEKMQLLPILPFEYFDIKYFKWNQQQSSFIAFDEYGHYCVIKRVCSIE